MVEGDNMDYIKVRCKILKDTVVVKGKKELSLKSSKTYTLDKNIAERLVKSNKAIFYYRQRTIVNSLNVW